MSRKKQKSKLSGILVLVSIIAILVFSGVYFFDLAWGEDSWKTGMLFMLCSWTILLIAFGLILSLIAYLKN